jgi:hypothetical protein
MHRRRIDRRRRSPADPDNDAATPVFRDFGSDLAAYADQTVRIRWRFSSDGGSEYAGFWLGEAPICNCSAAGDVIFANGVEQGRDYVCR